MIAYMIQIHDRFDQALALIEKIRHPENVYFVVIDSAAAAPERFRTRLSRLANVHVFDDLPGTWGGASLVSATLETMARALETSRSWRYFLNLSGVDVPLKTQAQIFDALEARRAEGKRSFIADFGTYAFKPFAGVDRSVHEVETVRFRSDLTLRVMGQARELFACDGGPIRNPDQRIRLHVSEDIAAKTLNVRPLFALEAQARAGFFADHPYHFGRQWFILDRAACEFAVSSALAARVFEFVKTVMIPDECFFQTLFRAAGDAVDGVAFDDNYRFYLGEPVFLEDRLLPELQGSSAFFARKFFPESEQTTKLREFLACVAEA